MGGLFEKRGQTGGESKQSFAGGLKGGHKQRGAGGGRDAPAPWGGGGGTTQIKTATRGGRKL